MDNWDQYAYTRPVAAALKDAFGVDFVPSDNGGGCICLSSDIMEGGVCVLISAAGEPMLFSETEIAKRQAEQASAPGYAIGVYSYQNGYPRSYATDHLATTPEAVVQLTKRALTLAGPERSDDGYPDWTRAADGTISTARSFT